MLLTGFSINSGHFNKSKLSIVFLCSDVGLDIIAKSGDPYNKIEIRDGFDVVVKSGR